MAVEGRRDKAAPSDRKAERLQAEFTQAVRLHAEGRVAAAEDLYRRLLERTRGPQPRLVGRLAQARLDQDDPEDAARLAGEALRHGERDPFLHQVQGVALRRLGRLEEALASLCRAADHAPEDPAIRASLGNVLSDLGRWTEAEAALRASLARAEEPGVLARLALVLRHSGRPVEALDAALRAVAIAPDNADARLERGMALLNLGRLREGFRDYESRFDTAEATRPRLPGMPWEGEPPDGLTVLLYPEQGLGDMIQFARFAPLLAERGARVLLVMRPPLVRLLRTMPAPGVEVIPEGVRGVAFDRHAPLMSVPGLLGLDLEDIPAPVPYLYAEPERVERWREAAGLGHGFGIGIAWQGKPTSKADVGRSFPVALFKDIARLPGVRLIALQKGTGREQLARLPPGMAVEGLGEGFDEGPDAFLDTAAVMASLDLVITSDTAIAHLAGALGRPVWVVLKHGAEWRWLRDREDSPWYPTMRLFRQETPGDWEGVFARVETALRMRLAAVPRVPVSWGELLDKITILEIKAARFEDPAKRRNVLAERAALEAARDATTWRTPEVERLVARLKAVNEALWDIEDAIREHERRGDFGPSFVDLARRVYLTNDRRAALKREINAALGSKLVEEKGYADYGGTDVTAAPKGG